MWGVLCPGDRRERVFVTSDLVVWLCIMWFRLERVHFSAINLSSELRIVQLVLQYNVSDPKRILNWVRTFALDISFISLVHFSIAHPV